MKKILIIGVVICLVALTGIGAAFATGMNFSGVNALSLGQSAVPQINCTGVVYALDSEAGSPVEVDGVQIKLDQDISNAAVSVSLRDINGNELAYYAANGVTLPSDTWSDWLGLYDESNVQLPNNSSGVGVTPDKVYYVKVTVANDSAYNPSISNYGPGSYTGP